MVSSRDSSDPADPVTTGSTATWTADRPLRLIIAGGGTGGHVQPAVAVLQELAARRIAVEALWVGSAGGTEEAAARDAGVPFRTVATGKLRRYLDLQNLRDTGRIPIGVLQAARIVRGFRPDVVLSTGGFVSVPTVIGSWRAAPVVTHEQTAILGLATRINRRFGARLAVSYPATVALAGGQRVTVTGNPVRATLFDGDAGRGRATFGLTGELPVLTVMGGARGATPINERVRGMLPGLLEHTQIVHQAGPASANGDAVTLTEQRATWPEHLQRRYVVREFIRGELPDVYAMTDVLLARSGAGTVAEVAAVGLASVLIPLTPTGGDEQRRNAALLTRAGAAVTVEQADATPEHLLAELIPLLADPARRRTMAEAARSLGSRDAAGRLVDLLIGVATAQ